MSVFPILLIALACNKSTDPLAEFDNEYVEIMARVGSSKRDNTRNVRNQEARERLIEAEKRQVAFFRSRRLAQSISVARVSDDPVIRAKGEAYWLSSLVHGNWTLEQKAEETRLLGVLEELAAQEATWSTPDSASTVSMDSSWSSVSKAADEWDQATRDLLYQGYIEHRMQVIGEDMQALISLRNEVAKQAGFDNYWELAVTTYGLNPTDVDELITELRPILAEPNQRSLTALQSASAQRDISLTAANLPLLERNSSLYGELLDNVESYYDADLAEERIVTAFKDMGLPADDWQVYTEPQRYARSGAYGFAIRPPENVAIVISQSQRWSMWQYRALAHEGGFAVWWQSLPPDAVTSPVLWSAPAPWAEGFAGLFERLVYEPGFSSRYIPEIPSELREPIQRNRAREFGDWITDSIVVTLTERELYKNPDDLASVMRFAAETRSELTGVPIPPADERGLIYDSAVLSPLHWNYPGYSQNFIFASVTECQLFEAIVKTVGDPITNANVGPMLRERLIRVSPGQSIPERIRDLTGDVPRTQALKDYLELSVIEP